MQLPNKIEKLRQTSQIKFIEKIVNKMIDADYCGMASEMAYTFLLGVIPFMLFLMSVFSSLGKKTLFHSILGFVGRVAPHDVSNLISGTLKEIIVFKQGGIMAIMSFFVTVVLASNAIAALMKGLNRTFSTDETRPFWYTRLLSVIMVFLTTSVLFISVNMIVFGKIIVHFFMMYTHMSDFACKIIMIMRWPVSFCVLYLTAYLCYFILPDIKATGKTKHKITAPGTLFFCIFWLAGSWGFSLYLNNLNTYNKVFGTVGAFAIMMVWLYYTSMIILFGGEINSLVFEKLKEKGEIDDGD